MNPRRWLALSLFACTGCMTSHALLQTAHTEPAGQWRFKAGVASVFNAIDDKGGRSVTTNTTPEPALRMGLTDNVDVGLAPWLATGAAVDAKLNVLDHRARAALAPRVAAGYALGSEQGGFGVEAGLIGSYRLGDNFEPYASLHFANYWFSSRNFDPDTELARNQQFAPRAGYGDGLVKAAAGLDFRVGGDVHALLEFAHWFPAQDDPGDGYALLANDVFALSLAYHTSRR